MAFKMQTKLYLFVGLLIALSLACGLSGSDDGSPADPPGANVEPGQMTADDAGLGRDAAGSPQEAEPVALNETYNGRLAGGEDDYTDCYRADVTPGAAIGVFVENERGGPMYVRLHDPNGEELTADEGYLFDSFISEGETAVYDLIPTRPVIVLCLNTDGFEHEYSFRFSEQ